MISLASVTMGSISFRISAFFSFHSWCSESSPVVCLGGSRAFKAAVVFFAEDASWFSRLDSVAAHHGLRSCERTPTARRWCWRRRRSREAPPLRSAAAIFVLL
uniref:Uncharacterized protein MANES_18G041500 n=1 Tax=Rhizophora mucronata TaxID=61149 RepID=A0A2P2JP22_RHIMU